MEEKQNQNLVVPKKELSQMYISHTGIILSNLSIVAFCVSLAALFAGFFTALFTTFYIILWFVILIFSVGTVFVIIPNYFSYLTKSSEFLNNFRFDVFINIVKYALPVFIATSILSIVLLSLDKHRNHKGRIIFSSVVLGLLVVMFLILIIGVK